MTEHASYAEQCGIKTTIVENGCSIIRQEKSKDN